MDRAQVMQIEVRVARQFRLLGSDGDVGICADQQHNSHLTAYSRGTVAVAVDHRGRSRGARRGAP